MDVGHCGCDRKWSDCRREDNTAGGSAMKGKGNTRFMKEDGWCGWRGKLCWEGEGG